MTGFPRQPSVLDVVAVIFLVLSTVRKLDVKGRSPEDFPHVPPDRFEAWRDREAGAYSLAIWACMAKLVLGYGFLYVALRFELGSDSIRLGGFSVDAAWAVALIVASRRRSAARKLAESLGIDLRRPPPAD
ncbi:MAG TPA: hypothetical protein VF989_19665 [Polyangiaceae bacterium]|jgi:hypothetical protein